MDKLHIEGNLSSQFVGREETLKQDECGDVVVSTRDSHDLIEIFVDVAHEVVDDDDAAARMILN